MQQQSADTPAIAAKLSYPVGFL